MCTRDVNFRCSSITKRINKNASVHLHSSVVHETIAQSYLNLEVIADVATVEFRADQFKFPVKQSLCVPVLVTDEMQDLLVVGHGVHPWNIQREAHVKTNLISNHQKDQTKSCCGTAC